MRSTSAHPIRLLWGVLLLVSLSAKGEAPGGTGLEISASGDLVGSFTGTADNRLLPREAEVLLYAPIDQLFDGTVNLAAHYETGQVFFETHELIFGSTKLIPRSRFRIGQFFLGFGRLNQFHRHDWPFTTPPKVHATFFDAEALNDTGIEYSYLFPTPFYLDLTVGITNGWIFGHSHNQGTKPRVPTHYARLVTYTDVFSGGGMQVGLNYVGRRDSAGTRTAILGLDLTAKWREGPVLQWFLQSEFWFRSQSFVGQPTETSFGFYLFPQYALSQNWLLGLRLDGFSVLSLKDAAQNSIGNFEYGFVPVISFKASEFSTVRAAYNWTGRLSQGTETNRGRFLEIQTVFILGSHPAHEF